MPSDEQLEAAIERLIDAERFAEAEQEQYVVEA